MLDKFRTVLETERAQLVADREEYLATRARIDDNLVVIDRELAAFDAFERACDPNAPSPGARSPGARSPGARSPGGARPQYGTRRVAVYNVVASGAGPMTRGEILHAMGLHGTKGAEMSVSNALSALKKTGRVTHENGRYAAV